MVVGTALMPSYGRTRATSNSMEDIMLDQFNTASLAKLSKAELLALLANYQAKLLATSDEMERAKLQSQISMIRSAFKIG